MEKLGSYGVTPLTAAAARATVGGASGEDMTFPWGNGPYPVIMWTAFWP